MCIWEIYAIHGRTIDISYPSFTLFTLFDSQYHSFVAGKVETTCKQILQFTTGLDAVPPVGLEPPVTVKFLHERDAYLLPGQTLFAQANTCGNTLILPIVSAHQKYKHFRQHLDKSISWSRGFANETSITH